MIRHFAIATLILCASILGSKADQGPPADQPPEQPTQEQVQPQVAPAPAPDCQCAPPRHHHRAHRSYAPRPPVVQKRTVPASIEKEAPVVHIQKIIEKTVIQRVIEQRPTIIIQAPPAIVRSQCGTCGQRPVVQQPCGTCGAPVINRGCNVGCGGNAAFGQQASAMPTRTDDGLLMHPSNANPDGVPCQRMVNGQLMTGKCW